MAKSSRHQNAGGKGVSEQGTTGDEAADHQQPAGSDPPENRAAEKGRHRRADRQQCRQESREIDRLIQLFAHGIPGDAEHGVGQSETDEADVDDDKQHQMPPPGRHCRKKRFHNDSSILLSPETATAAGFQLFQLLYIKNTAIIKKASCLQQKSFFGKVCHNRHISENFFKKTHFLFDLLLTKCQNWCIIKTS